MVSFVVLFVVASLEVVPLVAVLVVDALSLLFSLLSVFHDLGHEHLVSLFFLRHVSLL